MPGRDNHEGEEFRAAAYYDGDCQVCSREVEWLRHGAGCRRILFVDISAPAFDADRDAGIPIVRHQDCLQTRLRSGEVFAGVEAVRHLHRIALAERRQRRRAPLLGPLFDWLARALFKQHLRGACERMLRWCTRSRKLA